VLRNLGREAAACTLTLRVEADFADLFEVKQGLIRRRGHHSIEHGEGQLRLARRWLGQDREVHITAQDALTSADAITFRVIVRRHPGPGLPDLALHTRPQRGRQTSLRLRRHVVGTHPSAA
jgi:hypothetical protein